MQDRADSEGGDVVFSKHRAREWDRHAHATAYAMVRETKRMAPEEAAGGGTHQSAENARLQRGMEGCRASRACGGDGRTGRPLMWRKIAYNEVYTAAKAGPAAIITVNRNDQ